MHENELLDVYNANTLDEQKKAYDNWADNYERDLFAMGYRLPGIIAAVFTRFVNVDAGPILDAGCGGGVQAEPLALLGYKNITGIDLSVGMLEIAKQKNLYAELRQMTLGDHLDFPDNTFSAVISAGTITPGHAPPETFDELVRVTKKDALIVFSLRVDDDQEPAYPAYIKQLESSGQWSNIFSTPDFHTMPYGEPTVRNCVHVYQVTT
ncbi:MAG: class I SAM-dependent methyltransferase [Granulosicoccaceae bacterium]